MIISLLSALLLSGGDGSGRTVDLWSFEPGQGTRTRTDSFTLGVRVEYWEAEELEIAASDNVFGLSDDAAERGVEARQYHSAGFIQGTYTYGFSKAFLRGHAALGWERLGTKFETEANPIFGTGAFGNVYDAGFVWELGGAFGYQVDKSVDLVGVISYRAGESEDDSPSGESVDFEYGLLRVGGEVGYKTPEGLRLFLGARYSLYQAEWELSDPNPEVTYEFEFDQPFGVNLGVEFHSKDAGPVGRIELQVVDVLGFVASTGWRF